MFYGFVKGFARFIMFFCIRVKSEGIKNVPQKGVIYAVNHRSWLDPVMVAMTSPRQLTFMAKKELFKNRLFAGFLKKFGAFPVNRGMGDLGAVKTALTILKNEKVMMIFPEGTRVKKGESVPAKAGVALFATRAKVPVVPVKICGEYGFLKKITVVYGKPLYFDEYYGQKPSGEELRQLSQNVMNTVYALEAEK